MSLVCATAYVASGSRKRAIMASTILSMAWCDTHGRSSVARTLSASKPKAARAMTSCVNRSGTDEKQATRRAHQAHRSSAAWRVSQAKRSTMSGRKRWTARAPTHNVGPNITKTGRLGIPAKIHPEGKRRAISAVNTSCATDRDCPTHKLSCRNTTLFRKHSAP